MILDISVTLWSGEFGLRFGQSCILVSMKMWTVIHVIWHHSGVFIVNCEHTQHNIQRTGLAFLPEL